MVGVWAYGGRHPASLLLQEIRPIEQGISGWPGGSPDIPPGREGAAVFTRMLSVINIYS